MPHPSNVLSWWDLNTEVLERLKARFCAVGGLPLPLIKAVRDLTLDSIDIVNFSQIVSDVFADGTWSELLQELEGELPNAGHIAIADLAKSGRCRTLLTTNFDTLVERALEAANVDHLVLTPSIHRPPDIAYEDSRFLVVKLHGSITNLSSMVDLSTQKDIGLGSDWRAWLSRLFEERDIHVVGFSGRDLDAGPDYLGLISAAPRITKLRWLERDGVSKVPSAIHLIDLCGERGRFVKGRLPEYLVGLSGVSPEVSNFESPSPRGFVERWFSRPQVTSLLCGVALARLLRSTGLHGPASGIREEIRRALQQGHTESSRLPEPRQVARALACIGADEVVSHPWAALSDLSEALEIERRLARSLPLMDVLSKMPEHQLSGSEWYVVNHLVLANLALGRLGPASRWLETAEELADKAKVLSGGESAVLAGSTAMARGNLSMALGAPRDASLAFRDAFHLFLTGGDWAGRQAALLARGHAAAALGEPHLANLFVRHSGVTSGLPGVFSEQAGAGFLLDRLRSEWVAADSRFDEVLFSVLESDSGLMLKSGDLTEVIRELSWGAPGVTDFKGILNLATQFLLAKEAATTGASHATGDSRLTYPLTNGPLRAAIRELGTTYADEAMERLERATVADELVIGQAFAALRALSIVGNVEELGVVTITLVDGFIRYKDWESSHSILDHASSWAPSRLVAPLLERRARVLIFESLEIGGGAATEVEPEVTRLKGMVEQLGATDDLAFCEVYHAVLLAELGLFERARNCVNHARDLARGRTIEARIEYQANRILTLLWKRSLPRLGD
jgi:hypothetical protein